MIKEGATGHDIMQSNTIVDKEGRYCSINDYKNRYKSKMTITGVYCHNYYLDIHM